MSIKNDNHHSHISESYGMRYDQDTVLPNARPINPNHHAQQITNRLFYLLTARAHEDLTRQAGALLHYATELALYYGATTTDVADIVRHVSQRHERRAQNL